MSVSVPWEIDEPNHDLYNGQVMFGFLKKKNTETTKARKVTHKLTAKELEGIDAWTYQRRWWILGTLCLTLLGVMLANSSLNMALPMMARDLGLSQLELTWVVNVYTLVFASLLFIAGAVGDRYGRKLAMQIGLAVFTAGSLYAGFLAQTGTELIISRIVMGIGASFVMPTTLSIINNTFPKRERARAVAIWGAIAGVGMMFGSVISGVLLEHFTWHSLFYFSAMRGLPRVVVFQLAIENISKDLLICRQKPAFQRTGIRMRSQPFGRRSRWTTAYAVGVDNADIRVKPLLTFACKCPKTVEK